MVRVHRTTTQVSDQCDGSDTINTPLGESESRWCLGTPSVTVTARAVPGRPAGSRLAIANDPPPLAGFPDLGPDGAQVWRRFGDRRHVSQLLSAQVCAHSPAGSGAPSHLELRHSLQVLGCSAGGRPLPPPGLIAPDNSGPGLRPTASGCRPRPLVVAGSGQWAGPPHPPPGRDPRPLNPAKSGPPKGRIFPDFCPPAVQRPGGVGGLRPLP